jgi:CRISPR-associated protein Cmr4
MNWQRRRYLLMTLDPVHIGTGGYRLGRVDNAIVREPGTNLPKIPGSSLSGAVRSAAAMRINKTQCAGQGGHCADFRACPICYTFGSARDGGTSGAGAVSLSDARLVLFPVASWDGPVWLSTLEILQEFGFNGLPTSAPASNQVVLSNGLQAVNNGFGLGWLMLDALTDKVTLSAPASWQSNELSHALARTVIVHESVFAHLVNSGLEVRTSVAIEPDTGAAKDGALFTYEAIPRAAFMSFDVTVDDYRLHNKNGQDAKRPFPFQKDGVNWSGVESVVKDGLSLTEYLGIGGMGTRGFGRIRKLAEPIVEPPENSTNGIAETSSPTPAEGGNGDGHSGQTLREDSAGNH